MMAARHPTSCCSARAGAPGCLFWSSMTGADSVTLPDANAAAAAAPRAGFSKKSRPTTSAPPAFGPITYDTGCGGARRGVS